MKQGASRADQIQIKKMAADDVSIAAISKALEIDPKVVKAFVPKPAKK